TWHFAPTERSAANLRRESCKASSIYVTGNTVIDALKTIASESAPLPVTLRPNARLLLVTLHRRESHGRPLASILDALRTLIANEQDLEIILPVHPNPNVSGAIYDK